MRRIYSAAVRNHSFKGLARGGCPSPCGTESAEARPRDRVRDEILETDEAALELRRAIESLPPRTKLAMGCGGSGR